MLENSFTIETYGCVSNQNDSHIISNVLSEANYQITSLENAQFIIINTCAVKEQTESKIKARLRVLHERYHKDQNIHIVIAGCLPHIAPNYIEKIRDIIPSFAAIIGLDCIEDLPEIFTKLKQGDNNLIFKSKTQIDKARFYINYHPGKITGIIPISEGCTGSCTYCCVKNARGKLICYNPEYIIRNVEHQLKQGIKQLYLTSQDCSIYEYNSTNLLGLVKQIANLDYKFFLRIGMINPAFLIHNFDQLISIFKLEKVYQFLHIPIQSGSEKVLQNMERKYIISDIIDKLDILRKTFPHLTISTDIICGFPGETEYDFYRTINFIKWLRPEILNISKFTPRPGTKAKKMEQIESRTIKERSIRLSRIFRNSLKHINEGWQDWEGEVLVLHEGQKSNQAFGRNFTYKNVFLEDYKGEFGTFLRIKIVRVDGFNLFGQLV